MTNLKNLINKSLKIALRYYEEMLLDINTV